MKLEITPIKNGKLNVKYFNFTKAAAATIGVDNKNENLATDFLSIPIALPTVIVTPDLDTPGNAAANACDTAINNDCLKFISLYFRFDLDFICSS